jgi:hypothetical protein
MTRAKTAIFPDVAVVCWQTATSGKIANARAREWSPNFPLLINLMHLNLTVIEPAGLLLTVSANFAYE